MNITETDKFSDIDLIERISQKDENAFTIFQNRYRGLVYTVAYKVLNDISDAQDVTQDVFSMLWTKSSMYNTSRGKASSWLGTVAKNKSIDRFRSIQRRLQFNNTISLETVEEIDTQTPDKNIKTLEKNNYVRNAVIKLNSEQKEVIEMLYFKGLTQKQIATRIDKPLSTVKARIHRGLVRLRELVPADI